MKLFELITPFIGGIAVLICLAVVFWQRYQTRSLIKKINQMLDMAIDGSFSEHNFDESLLSSLEARLNRYLAVSFTSAQNITVEKEKIKELISDISHQTKTPIANILLYAELLAEQNLSKESKACVNALQAQGEKLRFLIDSLVKLSRLETGILTFHPLFHEIQTLFNAVEIQFASEAVKKGIKLKIEPTEASAVFDLKWTTEALCNLVENAIKYTPENGAVCVSVILYEMFCRIDVADTGIGILEEEQPKVFLRFYRSPSVIEKDGVGIGLYLTRQVLAGQGGYIKVKSKLGEGSVFSMFLPREG